MIAFNLWISEFRMTSGEWSVLHILNPRTPAQLISHCSFQSWKPKIGKIFELAKILGGHRVTVTNSQGSPLEHLHIKQML